MAEDRVCIGVITAPHGVRGMVKIKPFTATPEAVAAYGPVWLEDGRRLKVEVKSMAKGLCWHGLTGSQAGKTLRQSRGCPFILPVMPCRNRNR